MITCFGESINNVIVFFNNCTILITGRKYFTQDVSNTISEGRPSTNIVGISYLNVNKTKKQVIMSQPWSYTILPIEETDEDDVMELLKITFFVDEPLNAAVGLCDTDPCTEVEEYCKAALLKGWSYKAVDAEGNIVGVIINGICPLKEEEGNELESQAEKCKNAKFQKILQVLSKREEGSRLPEKFPQDHELLDVKVAATHPNWRKRGIMNNLVKETEEAAKRKGVRLIRLDTSSAYSAMSAERLGYTCIYRARYTDIQVDGKPIIVPDPPHVEDRVYIKEIL